MNAPWWLLTLAVIGGFAAAGAVVSLFFALGRRPRNIDITGLVPLDHADFLPGLAGTLNAPLQKGGAAQLLNNGDAFMTAFVEAVAEAEHSIHFMVYIWEPGVMSDRILQALTARAADGIEVRILFDAVGALRAPKDDVVRFVNAGGRVAYFRRLELGKLTRYHKRNHRRAILIDGAVGFTGGIAVGDKWLGDAQDEDHWRDSMVRVSGCLASNLQAAFTEIWAYCSGEILIGPGYYPEHPAAEAGDEPVASHINIVSSPAAEEHPLRLLFVTTFAAARERLWINTPYFVPDRHTRAVVAERARAGVDVRILMPDHHTDAKPIRQAAHSYYDELLSAGVRIYEYTTTMMHAKHVVADGVWAIVGSANMDIRSKELNMENVLGIQDRGFAEQLEEAFERDLERSREIRLDEWRRRGPGKRALERLCVLFAEQY